MDATMKMTSSASKISCRAAPGSLLPPLSSRVASKRIVIGAAAPPEGAATAPAPFDIRSSDPLRPVASNARTSGNILPFAPPEATSSKKLRTPRKAPMDGNEAAAHVAYAVSDVSFIYPITPATVMGELVDQWAAEGKTNVFGNVMSVTEMESETGAAGALHGALAAGSLATTFTCSQGLLLMVPNMYKIAGELTPCVLHVTARALARHALSIFGDHQDVMAVRQTGWAMLCSHSVQEAHDMALVAHLATLRTSLPFVHFFDGFRTSHEINTIEMIDNADIQELLSKSVYAEAIRHHRTRALNPTHPHQRGTAQGSDVYFQCVEAANPFYDNAFEHVLAAMAEVTAITGRSYKPYEYVGAPDADKVIVIMGSGSQAVEEAVEYLNGTGHRVGVLKVRLFRPWRSESFLGELPSSVSKIAVLDRTKESGAAGEPMYQQVAAALHQLELDNPTMPRRSIVGGRFGLASKEFLPSHAVAVFENLDAPTPMRDFTVGIMDDVTRRSLPPSQLLPAGVSTLPPGTFECLFWGMGSDGTVGANKEAIKIIASNTPLSAQAYFSYDAHKSGGVTVSHLRFGPSKIRAPYLVQQADYMAVNHQSYMAKYDTLAGLKPGGVLVLNTTFTTVESLSKYLPASVKKRLAALQPRLYLIDALSVARSSGLGKHVNMVMQTVFFNLSGVLTMDKAIALLKKSISKAYERKGPEVVAKNHAAVDAAIAALKHVEIPASWADVQTAALHPNPPAKTNSGSRWEFMEQVARPMLALEGDKLPVSIFSPEGFVPPGTTIIEKRAIASQVPVWKSENCTQCNICAFVCPHAAIRPSLAQPGELANAPAAFTSIPAKGPGLQGLQYRIQVSPYDCTGCDLCTHACPDNALEAKPLSSVLEVENANWDFARSLPVLDNLMDRTSVKGSQLQQPLMEFSGACEGCGETPYVKLLTQLFGDRLIIANATGCSSIWGGSAPSNPYTTNADGYGPAWANSLFEDNAQFGLGIATGTLQRRQALHRRVEQLLAAPQEAVAPSEKLRSALSRWAEHYQDAEVANVVAKELQPLLEAEKDTAGPALAAVYAERDMLHKPSTWIVGGDGWAYDIGFGGLDHVLASGENVNILVLDTEVYSNTGGQRSKATPMSAVAKFAAGGKERPKKDLGAIAMSYGDVYVASTSLHANYGQVVKAMTEAERYPGVSLVLCYSPCMLHGISSGMCSAIDESKMAVDTGYWPLYRYNPAVKEDSSHHRFQLDSKKLKGDIHELFAHENRFQILERKAPEAARHMHEVMDESVHERFQKYKNLAAGGPGIASQQQAPPKQQ
ncbi:pyruvate-ferredoxin oxidoreductase [Volvox carteri f. nagariensis]|uniref:pyruvate dehydrogenase (NADP(+)) n=1 Tax=Volvox carteri f. nagariensis TaxID=3068 RepID=D8TSG3_VOLCA|nr:pyruvate-ferredoxin oxidoreductase [Volvox carteri f. nagariensis]EFJ49484.1 pyruvate-ferredoxin oxidoreductase [Volvox carteri f. nagariensis]|eukprot:XP_002949465.1 pyruvate-ferredoxin oxidoreductase [Volvox carteri f. nagariensis]